MAQNKYFICTLGTSVANGLNDTLRSKQKAPGAWDDRDVPFEKSLAELVSAAQKDKSGFHKCCAEATVLRKAGVSKGDRVALLSTDTGLARICGEAAKRLIVAGFGLDESAVDLVRVQGLQVNDAERLRREGLPKFVKTVVSRIDENRYGYEMFLCPVGGYKGIVPFLTALGMAYHLPVLYTFEHIDSLLRLPPLPFSIDRELYMRAKDALLALGEKLEMREDEFLARIKGYKAEERDIFLSFVEPSLSGRPGFVMSTAFTETFAPDFECQSAPLSPQAIQDLDILSHTQWYRVACKMAILSQDRLMRMQWSHQKVVATDLMILKQGNTSIRLLGYERGGKYYVCRILAHDDYDRLLDSGKCPHERDFSSVVFQEWSPPPETLPDSVAEEESPYEAAMRMVAECDRKIQEITAEHTRKLNALKNAHVAEVRSLQQGLAKAQKGQRSVQSNLDKAKNDIQNLQSSKDALQHANENLQQENANLQQSNKSLQHANVALSEEKEAQIAKYEAAVLELERLRKELRQLRQKMAMAPQDTEAAKAAAREFDKKKAQIEEAFKTLLISDKTEIPSTHEAEIEELKLEQRKLAAQLGAKSEEVRSLEKENASLVESLREAHAKLQSQANLGFFGRLRRLFSPKAT